MMMHGFMLYIILQSSLWCNVVAMLLQVDEGFEPLEANDSAVTSLDVWQPFSPHRFDAQVLVQLKTTFDSMWSVMLVRMLKAEYRFLTEWTPQQKPQAYSPKQQPLMCLGVLRCTRPPQPPVIGIGRKGGFLYWVLACILPFSTAWLIIVCVSRGKSKGYHGNLEAQSWLAYSTLLSCIFFVVLGGAFAVKMVRDVWPSIATGVPLEVLCNQTPDVTMEKLLWVLPMCYFSACVCMIATFRFARIDFECPYLQWGPVLHVIGSVRSLMYYVLFVFCQWMAPPLLVAFEKNFFAGTPCVIARVFTDNVKEIIICMNMGFAGPNFGMVISLLHMVRIHAYCFFFWGDSTGSSVGRWGSIIFPQSCFTLLFWLLVFFTPYNRDRKFVAALSFLLKQAVRFGQLLPLYIERGLNASGWFYIIEVSAFAALAIILMRYQRVLPPQLVMAKYVRLSHLLKLRREGQMITRCQDVPDEAFGNPAKAAFLIIISHRWIDRYSCDVVTPTYPGGFRLATMVQRLEHHFPQSWAACSVIKGSTLNALSLAVGSALYTSHDVLIFFDFMSIPQQGRSLDGGIIQRTNEEQQLFDEVLPAMGALYTMFPVLVCPKVPDGVASYASSGWCFCEYQQASLVDNVLDNGSCFAAEQDELTLTLLSSREDHAVVYLKEFEVALAKKHFLHEGDREAVRKIVKGTMILRMLHDAVTQQNAAKVRKFLMQLSELSISEALHRAVDATSLDTVLHIAMRLPSQAIVDLLIRFGADPDHINSRGDKPGELFNLRRAWLPCLHCVRSDRY